MRTLMLALIFCFSVSDSNAKTIQITAGGMHNCALSDSGIVTCWGNDFFNQLQIPKTVQNVKQISAGSAHTCALKTDGTVECWGTNISNQLNVPRDIINVSSISSGLQHTCAVTASSVKCWGYNEFGQTAELYSSNISQLIAGSYHNCILDQKGIPYCWGRYKEGQINFRKDLPELKSLIIGKLFTCYITLENTVECIGTSDFGQIAQAKQIKNPKLLAANTNSACVANDHKIECWGKSYNHLQRSKFSSFKKLKQITLGEYHGCALEESGKVTCWGTEDFGLQNIPKLP